MEEKVPKRITDEITLDLPRNWESRSLNELCKIKIGGTPKTNIKSFWNGSIKWATAKDISNTSGRFIQKTEKTITKEGSDRSAAKILPANTIVITARGTVGKMAITPEPMAINQTCYGLLAENIDNMFLYYSVKSAIEKLMGVSYGTVFDTITIKSFEDIRLLVPNNRAEQRAIAKILSDLDARIELNQNMNKTLEAIAQAIFKHWFIDFEFPNEEGKPYKSSGGEMVDSELGDIPKGWEVTNLGYHINFKKGKKPVEINSNEDPNLIPIISMEMLEGGHPNLGSPLGMNIASKYDPVMVMDGASSGRIEIGFEGIIGSTFASVTTTSDKVSNFYLYHTLKVIEHEIRNNPTGTSIPHTDKSKINKMKLLIPDRKVLQLFDEFIRVSIETIVKNRKEIVILDEIKNLVFPRLISGKIRVPLEE